MASSFMRKNDTHSNTQSLSSKRSYDQWCIGYTPGDPLSEQEVSEDSNNRPMADMADDSDNKKTTWAACWADWMQEAPLTL
jgi:hypothetical protein